MFAGLKGALGVVVMGQVGRGNIDGIDLLDEGVKTVEGLEIELFCKSVGLGLVGIEDGDDIGPAHNLGFRYKPAGYPPGTDDTDLADILRFLTELRTGNALGARKIDDFAILVQVVELPLPVGPDGKDIHIILLDIVYLLPHIILDDYLIGISGCFDSLDTLQDIVPDVEFSTSPIKAVARHTDDEVIAELFCPAKEVDVTLMEEVVGTVGDDFGHWVRLAKFGLGVSWRGAEWPGID